MIQPPFAKSGQETDPVYSLMPARGVIRNSSLINVNAVKYRLLMSSR